MLKIKSIDYYLERLKFKKPAPKPEPMTNNKIQIFTNGIKVEDNIFVQVHSDNGAIKIKISQIGHDGIKILHREAPFPESIYDGKTVTITGGLTPDDSTK